MGHHPTLGVPVCEETNRWFRDDRSHNGLQNEGEPGLGSVFITLLWEGDNCNFTTTAENVTQIIFLTCPF
jgi:hypothetical protein